jgi:hypothetical protein
MARIVEYEPVEGVEIEYASAEGGRKAKAPRFKRARLLDIAQEQIELGSREAFQKRTKLKLTIHTKRVQDLLTVVGQVAECSRCTVLRQQAFHVALKYVDVDDELRSKIAWAAAQYGKERSRPARRPVREAPAREEEAEPEKEAPAEVEAPTAPAETPAPAATAAALRGAEVDRPVALLELIRKLDDLEVTDDLIRAVIEAAEADMDVEVLFPKREAAMEETAREAPTTGPAPAAAPTGPVRPINVYRLSSRSSLHFSASGMPASPAAEMFYYSGLPAPETCFAAVLESDTMAGEGSPSIPSGALLVFSTSEPVEDGDFAYLKVRGNDTFAQVFQGKEDVLRIRFLNPAYPEEVVKRREIRVMCRLVGVYERR